jgi:hypothetical protein
MSTFRLFVLVGISLLINGNSFSKIPTNDFLIEDHFYKQYLLLTPFPKKLDYSIFKKALTGFYNIKVHPDFQIKNNILTIIDYNKPSYEMRMWVIDLDSKIILHKTYVAHGQRTGLIYASTFSNQKESHQSSLGFYLTDDVYMGKHGKSLNLVGIENGINNQAKIRRIVIHGAAYVSEKFIKEHGRLGRSWGCPAIPKKKLNSILTDIANNTCLFIHHHNKKYLAATELLELSVAAKQFILGKLNDSNMN